MLSGRLFRIPQYQRAYSWMSKQRRDLFDDIDRTRAMGADGQHFLATLVGLRRSTVKIVTDVHQVIEVVDGQQRITTLVLLLKAIAKSLDRSKSVEKRIASDLEETLVKPDKASMLLLQTNHDRAITSPTTLETVRTRNLPRRQRLPIESCSWQWKNARPTLQAGKPKEKTSLSS
ncbi:MAG: DUF262 domain-containing protein [Dehalococcoidia bacterium]